jgi:hypothetical protein
MCSLILHPQVHFYFTRVPRKLTCSHNGSTLVNSLNTCCRYKLRKTQSALHTRPQSSMNAELTTRDLRLPPRFKWIPPSLGLLLGVRWFKTDVSGLSIGSHLQGSSCPSSWTAWPLKMRPIGSPETSVLNHLTPSNNPRDGGIYPFTRCIVSRSLNK